MSATDEALRQRLDVLEAQVATRRVNASPAWERPDWYESSVQMALSALVRPGDLVFDLGANLGIISARAGELVGPFGRVVSFEASPRVVPQLHANLNYSNAFNVTVIHAAVTNVSNELAMVYYGADHPADSIMVSSDTPGEYVDTIALDDYTARIGRSPDVIKMDIEGAEQLALSGAEAILRESNPPLILEFDGANVGLVQWLAERGYEAVLDLATFEPFETMLQPTLVNGVFLHRENDRGWDLFNLAHVERGGGRLSPVANDPTRLGASIPAQQAGNYILELDYTEAGSQSDCVIEITAHCRGKRRLLTIATSAHLAKSYTRMPLWLDRPGDVEIGVARLPDGAPLLDGFRWISLVQKDDRSGDL